MADSEISETLLDKRTLQKKLGNGLLDKKTYQAHLEALPDLEGKYDVVRSTLGGEGTAGDISADAEASPSIASGLEAPEE